MVAVHQSELALAQAELQTLKNEYQQQFADQVLQI